MTYHRLFLLTLLFAIAPLATAQEKPLSRIMFGSCARESQPQPIWDTLVDQNPELFLFIGDNIYGDSEDMTVLKAKYDKLFAQPGFVKLRKTCPVLATWDDHDYGVNDGGEEYPAKAQSQKLFNDVFGVPEDSPRRKRPGIHDAQIFGPAGKRVQVILLDTRYFRSPLRKWERGRRPQGRGPYRPHEDDHDGTLLGEAQWKWLKEQLQKPAELRIIASSIQVIPREHGWEMWGNFPAERQRLFETIAQTKANGVVFISGDRHLAEISRIDSKDSGAQYPLYDITSSSLNVPGGGKSDEPNRYRIGDNFRLINFGSIVVDWQKDDPQLTFAIVDIDGKTPLTQSIMLSDLR